MIHLLLQHTHQAPPPHTRRESKKPVSMRGLFMAPVLGLIRPVSAFLGIVLSLQAFETVKFTVKSVNSRHVEAR